MKRQTITMAGAFAGMVSPVLFGAVLALLTVLQHDFMMGIGWRPLVDPADAWPSGLALGPYGFLQIANFVASGLLLALFAIGLHLEVGDGRGSEVGPCLLFVAGATMALMGFETDPIRRVGPRTLHGSYTTQHSCSSSSRCWPPSSCWGKGSRRPPAGEDTLTTPSPPGCSQCCCSSRRVWPTTCSSSRCSPGSSPLQYASGAYSRLR